MDSFNENTAERLADLFSTLGDPSRLRVIECLLSGEQSVGQTAAMLGMSDSAVSHQLQRLRVMRLVRSRKQGRRIFYSLDDDHVRRLFQMGLDHVLHG